MPDLSAILRQLVRHPQYKLLSFVIAVMAWWYVQANDEAQGKVKADVDWMLPSELVSVEQLPPTVTLTVRGTPSSVRRAKERPVAMPVDLQEIEAGEHSLEFAAFTAEGLPSGVDVLETIPSIIRFQLDEVLQRNVKINPVVIGEPGSGYTVGQIEVRPAVVEIRGPRSVVAELSQVNSQPVDVSGLTIDETRDLTLDLPRGVMVGEAVQPTALVHIEPLVETRTFGKVPVHVWGKSGWRSDTGNVAVTLEGPSAALREVEAEHVVAFVHLPENPTQIRYEAPFGPTEGLRMRILHGSDPDITVTRVVPPRVDVYRSVQ